MMTLSFTRQLILTAIDSRLSYTRICFNAVELAMKPPKLYVTVHSHLFYDEEVVLTSDVWTNLNK